MFNFDKLKGTPTELAHHKKCLKITKTNICDATLQKVQKMFTKFSQHGKFSLRIATQKL
uniref:Uncharacterized protein n=1 Tax=Arundo donax TaxID=35708 RepID=A0A0A9DZM5_ARUDO